MNDLTTVLERDFVYTKAVTSQKSGVLLRLCSQWQNRTPGVASIEVQLTGINPLTDEDVSEKNITARFSAFNTEFSQNGLTYYGKFYLKKTAVLDTGERMEFGTPDEIFIKYEGCRPKIKKLPMTSRKGYTIITMNCNCWKLARNNIWIKYDGHYQCLPISSNAVKGEKKWYVPTEGEVEIEYSETLKSYLSK